MCNTPHSYTCFVSTLAHSYVRHDSITISHEQVPNICDTTRSHTCLISAMAHLYVRHDSINTSHDQEPP